MEADHQHGGQELLPVSPASIIPEKRKRHREAIGGDGASLEFLQEAVNQTEEPVIFTRTPTSFSGRAVRD